MLRNILLLALLLFGKPLFASEFKHEFHSEVAKQPLVAKVLLPDGYTEEQAYPVLYTTSGGQLLKLLRQNVDWLSHVDMGAIPRLIIVTVPAIEIETHMHPKYVGASGLTDAATLAVLRDELIPLVEKAYSTRPFRIIDGYSSHGNFPLYALLNAGDLFHAYISTTPALALNKTELVPQLTQGKPRQNFKHKFFYLSRGNFAENVAPVKAFQQALQQQLYPGLEWVYQDMSADNFLTPSVVFPLLALQQLFSDRRIDDFSSFVATGEAGIRNYYQQLSAKYGYVIDAEQSLLDFAFYLSRQQRHQQATQVVKGLVDAAPGNIFLLTRYAQILKTAEQTKRAMEVLKRAQQLAQKARDQDALSYIQQKISELKS